MEKNITINKIPEIILEILRKRGIEGNEKIFNFLFPQLADLPAPSKMKGMDKAVDLIITYLTAEKQIVIWGDYDVDGTTGTALLVTFLKKLSGIVTWHIPNRLEEGYGLNISWFYTQKKFQNTSDFLLITVDCGISNRTEIDHIQKMGGTVIVTDHHNIPANSLPHCVILNPSQKDCGFNQEHLAGVGVAFYLAAGVKTKLTATATHRNSKRINLKQFLAFVALGTIADVVQLSATNRVLVRAGIEAMQDSPFPGITALLHSNKIFNEKIGSEDIGFLLGPLINAAGRIGDSFTVVELLTTEITAEAEKLIKKLARLNTKRKSICSDDFEKAKKNLSKSRVAEEKCIVIEGEIHQGIAGIVASRLVDMYGVPSFVFGKKQGPHGEAILVGSARSIEGVSVVNALDKTSKLLLKYGGHHMAAGATILEENFSEFSLKLKHILAEFMSQKPMKKISDSAFPCVVEELMNEKCLAFFELLEPFGPGNEMPIFADKTAKIVDSKRVGKNLEHLQVAIRGKYSNLKGIGFGFGERRVEIQQNPQRDLRYTPTKNRFRGRTSWQIRVIDL